MYRKVSELPLFKNVFPDYETFKSWYTSTPLSDDELDVPSEKTFTLIAYEYNCSHCAMGENDFKQRFANDLYTYYKEFEATTKGIIDLMKLKEEDIAIADKTITNFGDTPETPLSTDAMSVDFVSKQQKVITEKGKLQVQRELLANKRALTTKTFLKRFKHLFKVCLDTPYTQVIAEPKEE